MGLFKIIFRQQYLGDGWGWEEGGKWRQLYLNKDKKYINKAPFFSPWSRDLLSPLHSRLMFSFSHLREPTLCSWTYSLFPKWSPIRVFFIHMIETLFLPISQLKLRQKPKIHPWILSQYTFNWSRNFVHSTFKINPESENFSSSSLQIWVLVPAALLYGWMMTPVCHQLSCIHTCTLPTLYSQHKSYRDVFQ